jgi:hypothetical protein
VLDRERIGLWAAARLSHHRLPGWKAKFIPFNRPGKIERQMTWCILIQFYAAPAKYHFAVLNSKLPTAINHAVGSTSI